MRTHIICEPVVLERLHVLSRYCNCQLAGSQTWGYLVSYTEHRSLCITRDSSVNR